MEPYGTSERKYTKSVELHWFFKFRYEMMRVHAFWYDLFRYDAICQFQVTRSVTIESPIQIRLRTFEYDYPDRVQAHHDRGSRFDTILYAQIRNNTFITIRRALLR